MSLVPILASLALFASATLPCVRAQDSNQRATELRNQATKALEAEQDHRALALLQLAWRLEPGNESTRQLYAAATLRIGEGMLADKEAARARDLFRQGLAVHPNCAGLHLGLGQAEIELHHSAEAERSFARAVELGPDLVAALVALGSLKYDKRDFVAARALLARAVRLDARNPIAQTLLQRATDDGIVEKDFAQHASSNFVLSYHGERSGLDRFQPEISAYLEQCFVNMTKLLRRKPKQRIMVVLYTRTQFQSLNRNADWVQAYYDGKVRIPLDSWQASRQRVQATIRHELTHAFVQEVYGTMTAWLHEGFAQTIEGLETEVALREFEKAALIPATRLRRSFVLERNPYRARRLYAESFLVFQEIQRRLGSRGLAPLFERIAQGEGSLVEREDKALVSLLGLDLDGLIRECGARHEIAVPTEKSKPGR